MPQTAPSRLTIRSEDKSPIEGPGIMQLLKIQAHRDQENTLHGQSLGSYTPP